MAEPRLRRAVRALLIDPDDRVLLVRFDLPALTLWTAPGGGVDPDETALAALARELREEVGFELVGEPPLVWHRPVVLPGAIEGYDGQVDDFYLVRCHAFEPRGELSDAELAAEHLMELRWWTPAELATSAAVFGPRDLPARFAALLLHGHAGAVTVGL